MKTDVHLWQYPSELLLVNVSDKICGGNQDMQFMFNKFLPEKSCCLCENVEKILYRQTGAIDSTVKPA